MRNLPNLTAAALLFTMGTAEAAEPTGSTSPDLSTNICVDGGIAEGDNRPTKASPSEAELLTLKEFEKDLAEIVEMLEADAPVEASTSPVIRPNICIDEENGRLQANE